MIIKDPNYAHEYYGMSTDTKPLSVPNASLFYEIDTSDIYMFDEDGKQWFKQNGGASGGSSGGGSSSGSSGVLIVNALAAPNSNGEMTMRLDKTWQEIYDAAYAVVSINASANGEVNVAKKPIILFRVVNGVYAVVIDTIGLESEVGDAVTFTTDSPDGYPFATLSQPETGEG